MSFYEFQVCLHNATGIPRDDCINVLRYDIQGIADSPESVADEIAQSYGTLSQKINVSYQNITIKVYEFGTTGPPLLAKNYTQFFGGAEGPTEVALCLSYSADDDQAGSPRRRGRIYLPYAGAFARPSAGLVNSVLDFGELLAQVGTASATTWHMYSVRDAVHRKIESISCDNTWDTQRRRGLRATSRTRRDVQ